MNKKIIDACVSALISSILPFNPLSKQIVDKIVLSLETSEEDGSTNDQEKEDLLNLIEKHSDLLKELAIIRRIDTAEKVSIEEFYDLKGDAGLGVQSDSGNVNLGLKGNGQKVVKRVYNFEGWREGSSFGIEGLADIFNNRVEDEANQINSDNSSDISE